MKKRTIFSVIMVVCLLLSACTNRDNPSSNSSLAESSSVYSSQAEEPPYNPISEEIYSFEKLPGVEIPQADVQRITFYDGAMGEFGEVTAPNDIEQVMNVLRKLEIYNEKTEPNPTTVDLSHGCLYWLDFFESVDDEQPDFSIGLDSFFIAVGGEKTGPYRTENEETVIKEILAIKTNALRAK